MFLTRWLTPRSRDARLTHRRSFRPVLEALDGRDLPSTLTVLNTNDSGPGSLRDAVAAAHSGDTINFDKSLKFQTITLSGQIVLDKNLNIEGPTVNGYAALSVLDPTDRVFDVRGGVRVGLSGLGLGGQSTTGPGGGSVLNEGGTVAVTACGMGNDGYGSASLGGAIYNAAGTLSLSKSFLSGSAQSGGAIYNAAGTVTVDGCMFGNATATGTSGWVGIAAGAGLGGAIYNAAGAALDVTNSSFTGTAAYGGRVVTGSGIGGDACGGAIYSAGGSVSVSKTTFQYCKLYPGGNIATSRDPGQWDATRVGRGMGGALYIGGGTLDLTGCTFTQNLNGSFPGWFAYAPLPEVAAGGAVYLAAGAATVANCEFSANTVMGSMFAAGGAVYQAGGALTVTNSDFSGNVAEIAQLVGVTPVGSFGGAVCVAAGTTTVQNCAFIGNSAVNFNTNGNTPSVGGAIANIGGGLTISKNTTFAGDFAATADPDISGPYTVN